MRVGPRDPLVPNSGPPALIGRPARRATVFPRWRSGRNSPVVTGGATVAIATGGYKSPPAAGPVLPGSAAHCVDAAVHVHDLASGRREPVREQRDAGPGGRLVVAEIPAEGCPAVPH